MNYYNAEILIADDNYDLCQMIKTMLLTNGFKNIDTVLSCGEAERMIYKKSYSLIILDVNFPDEDGFSFYKRLSQSFDIPVIFLSARDKNEDRLKGLGLGADDYITKPFLAEELLLRCRAVLKRTYSEYKNSDRIYKIGDAEVNISAGTVKKTPESEETALTNKEYKLLNVFLENRGRILTFDFLAEAVWGENYYAYENTLMVHIRKLREKIELNPSNPKYIITMKGLGYRLNKWKV